MGFVDMFLGLFLGVILFFFGYVEFPRFRQYIRKVAIDLIEWEIEMSKKNIINSKKNIINSKKNLKDIAKWQK